MSSLVLIEIRVSTPHGYVTVTAEWFKAYAGAYQYRVVSEGRPALYFSTADAAVDSATRQARRIYRSVRP